MKSSVYGDRGNGPVSDRGSLDKMAGIAFTARMRYKDPEQENIDWGPPLREKAAGAPTIPDMLILFWTPQEEKKKKEEK